jgi:hypothetical protein
LTLAKDEIGIIKEEKATEINYFFNSVASRPFKKNTRGTFEYRLIKRKRRRARRMVLSSPVYN